MTAEDIIDLPPSENSISESENEEYLAFHHGLNGVTSEDCDVEGKEVKIDSRTMEVDFKNEDGQSVKESEQGKEIVNDLSAVKASFALTETATSAEENLDSFMEIKTKRKDVSSISGVKRARTEFDEQLPSVRVIYNSLTSASVRKLQELLQKWSEWQAETDSLTQNPDQALESGEETYFPAVCVGLEKPSTVPFWIDNQSGNAQVKASIPFDGNSAPLYDRGYAMGLSSVDESSNLEGGVKIIDEAARCFNCGSYSHSLKDCQKPRNKDAVSSARKQLSTKRNQKSGSRIPTRYYQSSAGGKYDDLKPGILGAETRELLGLGELDPPPWLHRMREIGYPPGYLEPSEEDQPSGITIYADEDVKDEQDKEITGNLLVARKKMSVDFPGVNALIPKNADGELWGHAPPSGSTSSHTHRWNHLSQPSSAGHHVDHRRSENFRDDGPPGVHPISSPSMSSYPPRYGGYDYGHTSYSPRDYNTRPRSPTLGRSLSERSARSPIVYDDFLGHSSFSSSQHTSYASPKDLCSTRLENESYKSWIDRNLDSSNRDDYDWYRGRGRR